MAGRGKRVRAVSITDAPQSRDEERHHREVRYVTMMGIRIVCLILATVLVYAHTPYPIIWVPVLLFGVTVLPWLAVILANDRMPRRALSRVPRPTNPASRELRAGEPDAEHRVIDIEP
jgi:Flp pilus assembly protein TadB